jgi:hypothetical protein
VSPTKLQSSRTQRSSPAHVVQKDRSYQPEFLFRGLPFLRCSTHWRGSSTTLQLAFNWIVSRFGGALAAAAGVWTSIDSRTPVFRGQEILMNLAGEVS